MTTIAFDGKFIAADTQGNFGSTVAYSRKLTRLEDGTILGGAGLYSNILRFIEHYKNNRNQISDFPELYHGEGGETDILIIEPNGPIKLFCSVDNYLHILPENKTQYAIGSGECYAFGAMDAGASAHQAVLIASRHDPYTGGSSITCWQRGPVKKPDTHPTEKKNPQQKIIDFYTRMNKK
jgi:ATP-dependent HslUV protease subunit HslV